MIPGLRVIFGIAGITGTKHDQYRDCIDIAVKIAFALNNSGNTYQNITEILGSSIMKLITILILILMLFHEPYIRNNLPAIFVSAKPHPKGGGGGKGGKKKVKYIERKKKTKIEGTT